METAISLPDQIFQLAEESAKALGMSRDEFYAAALVDFISQQHSGITEQLNRIYSEEDSSLDAAIGHSQVASLPSERW